MADYYRQSKKAIKHFLNCKTERILVIPYKGKRLNSGCDWYKTRCWCRIWLTAAIIELSHKLPPSKFKNWLLRLTGAKIGKDVCLPQDVSIDHLFPELVTVGEGVLIGSGSYIAAHEFTIDRTKIGRTAIGKNTLIGFGTDIQPGVTIGKNCIIGVKSFVNKNVPDNEFWAGVPAKFIRRLK